MNVNKLEKEGRKWVESGIINENQFNEILKGYTKKDANVLVLLFAILLTGLAFVTFIFSEWAQVAHISRILVMLGFTLGLYILGDQLYQRKQELYGISFIVLGFIGFGASLFLTINIYDVLVTNVWPFIIWSIVGFLLYIVYSHRFIYIISLLVLTIGQMYSQFAFDQFNYILLVILIFAFGHYFYHHASKIIAYCFSLSVVVNLLMLSVTYESYYYWFMVYMLGLYIVSHIIPKEVLKRPFKFVIIGSMFIFNVFQSTALQEDMFLNELKLSGLFLIILILLIGIVILMKRLSRQTSDYVYLLLFIPTMYFPYASLFTIISIFLFSAGLLFIGYKDEKNELITYGTIAFLISTFTVYIQYAWDVMNKSLFFLIGGAILFLFSFFLERRRRKLAKKEVAK